MIIVLLFCWFWENSNSDSRVIFNRRNSENHF